MNNHKNFILEFLSSIAIQCSTSVIRENFVYEAAKFTNPQKFSPSKTLGYMVLRYSYREQTKIRLFVKYALLTTLTVDGLQGGRFTIFGN